MFGWWHNNDTIFCVLRACCVPSTMLTSLGTLVHLSLSDLRRQVLQLYRQGVRGKERLRNLPKGTWLTRAGMQLSTGFSVSKHGCLVLRIALLPPLHTQISPQAAHSGNTKENRRKGKVVFYNFVFPSPLGSHWKDPGNFSGRLTGFFFF